MTSTQNIKKASEMIKSIAEQTNLVALTPVIESARDDKAGNGFAVISDEIRKLAEQSGKFAAEIESVLVKKLTIFTLASFFFRSLFYCPI